MSRGNVRGLSGLMVAVLVVGTVASASAQEVSSNDQRFQVGLDEILVIEEISFDTDELPIVKSAEPIRLAALARTSVRDLEPSAQVSADQATSAPKGSKTKRTGRWLKKHWWVPTLVGVAVGVVLLEPFDDDKDDRPPAMDQ